MGPNLTDHWTGVNDQINLQTGAVGGEDFQKKFWLYIIWAGILKLVSKIILYNHIKFYQSAFSQELCNEYCAHFTAVGASTNFQGLK